MISCDQWWSTDEEDGSDLAQEGERTAAALAGEGFGGRKLGSGLTEFAQQKTDMEPAFAGGGGEKSIVADPGEAFGKDVDEPAPDELVRMERHDVGLASGAGGPTQQDVSPGIISNESLG